MSDPAHLAGDAAAPGFATVREIGPLGMILLRARPGTPGLEQAVMSATGTALPPQRGILFGPVPGTATGWMSPDEGLLILPPAQVTPALAAIADALQGQHHLAADVSDLRAAFRIEGPRADQVLMKLTPADLARLPDGELRRSRIAQTAAAFWRQDGGITLICLRSVAGYALGLLANAATAGSELF